MKYILADPYKLVTAGYSVFFASTACLSFYREDGRVNVYELLTLQLLFTCVTWTGGPHFPPLRLIPTPADIPDITAIAMNEQGIVFASQGQVQSVFTHTPQRGRKTFRSSSSKHARLPKRPEKDRTDCILSTYFILFMIL